MDGLVRLVRYLVLEIQHTVEGGIAFEYLDVISTLAERILRAFSIIVVGHPTPVMESCVAAMQEVVRCLNRMASSLEDPSLEPYGYHLPIVFHGARGRPKIQLSQGMLSYFFSNGFSATTTSMLLQVSLSTVRRRMREYNMTIRSRYSDISDEELDRIVTSVEHRNPNCGYRMMQGYVARLSHTVQQTRIRESMARTDPEGVVSRWCNTVHRRCYSVSSPNALWHIDGHHRLIRFDINY